MKKAICFLLILLSGVTAAQTSTVPESGVRDRFPSLVALTGARVVTSAGQSTVNATILIEDGVILAVGDIEIPQEARRVELEGKVVYPAFVEPYHEQSVSPKRTSASHWNDNVHPEWSTANDWSGNDNGKDSENLRKAGFAVCLLAPNGGVLKGSSVAVSLGSKSPADSIMAENVAQHIRLTSSRSRDKYPGSPMGAVALARQTFYDAEWYKQAWRAFRNSAAPRPETNAALAALGKAVDDEAVFVFDAIDEQYALRANRFAVEFGLNRVVLRGSGREYQRLDAICDAGHTIIVPLNFPKPPNVATPEATRDASLGELMHWRLAPENAARLRAAGADIVLTSHLLKNKGNFREQVIKAVQRGLDPDDALHACTLGPAKLLGIDGKVGSIAVGKLANLMVCDGDWLEQETKITETWVDGERFEHEHQHDESTHAFAGTWQLIVQTPDDSRGTIYLGIKEKDEKLSGTASTSLPKAEDHNHDEDHEEDKDEDHDEAHESADSKEDKKHEDEDEDTKASAKLKTLVVTGGRLSTNFSAKIWGSKNSVRLSGTLIDAADSGPQLYGHLIDENGKPHSFVGKKIDADDHDHADDTDEASADEDDEEQDSNDESTNDTFEVAVNFPLGAYGAPNSNPEPQSVLIENATVWTCGRQGILKNASVLVENGKITAVGENVGASSDVLRIDAQGKHVTPGIVDCHSHMATDGGVNESTQAITAEVRIGDFVDATDISIYRQLAGGVTTANVLHGSANPIGGQNQVIKLRWGMLPEQMKFAEAPQGIKFALGENVKQSNWGDEYRTRYPQSRLGVEQIMRDALIAAKEYEQRWETFKTTGKGLPPRRDLELDALLQIVNGERWIHCHSYRQDEILSLIRTLDDFDITIGTFQHILEGYKVTKEMAEHGAMGSAFSDWWAYKFEVFDAIPYNGALMHNAGIVVSFNSDDLELARHLNHEAAKAMKYGGVSREDALKFVTLNPAKQLRIDEHVGSLEPGKHADIAIWSGDPLQITSRCEQTWIDGVQHFDIEKAKQRRAAEAKVREQLVRMILDSGESMKKPGEKDKMWRDLFPRHDEFCGHGH